MRAFLSHSHADRSLADRLRLSLEEKGLIFNTVDDSLNGGTSWRQRVEEAIRSADAILLLLNSSSKVDEPQQLTWRLALQAVWDDPTKRWLPILLRDAKLPAFVRSGAAGRDVQAIRIRDPKDLGPAIGAILHSLSPTSGRRRREPSFPTDPIEIYPAVTDEDRAQQRESFAAIRKYAEQLKH